MYICIYAIVYSRQWTVFILDDLQIENIVDDTLSF